MPIDPASVTWDAPDPRSIVWDAAPTAPQGSWWTATRPYVAPVVEAGGAIAGGLLGAPAGPVGAAAGAGVGYMGGTEVMRMGDVAFGPPHRSMTGNEAALNALYQTGVGAALDTGVGVAGNLLSRGWGALRGLSPQVKAANILREAVGGPGDIQAARNALAQAPGAPAAQTLAGLYLPEVQALNQTAMKVRPRGVPAVLDAQKAATQAELEALAQATTKTEVRTGAAAAQKTLNKDLIPLRDIELDAANIAGQKMPGFTEKINTLTSVPDVPLGMPVWAEQSATGKLNLQEGAKFALYQMESLAAHGLKPLESGPIIKALQSRLANPEYASNIPVRDALNEVSRELQHWTSGGGVIDAYALDAIRKNAVNVLLSKNTAPLDPKSQQKAATSLLAELKPLIDDAITKAGGTGYAEYLAKYAAGAQEIAKTRLAGELLALWKDSPKQFAKMVNGDAPKQVEKILGPGKYDIQAELAPDVFAVYRKAADDITRGRVMNAQAKRGEAAIDEIITDNTTRIRMPSFINAKAATANLVLRDAEARLSSATRKALAEGMRSGKNAEALLAQLPTGERSAARTWLHYAILGAGANALAPEPQNALVAQ